MLKVGAFLKYLSDLNPETSQTRLALYNWLRNNCTAEEPFNSELIEMFCADALDHAHWVAEASGMSREIRFLIEQFNSFFTHKMSTFDLRFPEDMQIIPIERHHDVTEALSTYLNLTLDPEDKFRLLPEANSRFVAIVLKADRTVEARTYDRKFTLRAGVLEPLRRNLTVFYNAHMELSEIHEHQIEVAPHVTARFSYEAGQVTGVIQRGFVFQKMLEMKGEFLKDIPRLQVPLRRLEQFFIDRRSDKDYQSLIQKLERTRSLVQAGDTEAKRWAPNILIQAETLLEQIYAGDQVLTLLIRYLRATIPLEGTEECPTLVPIDVSASTSSSQTAGSQAAVKPTTSSKTVTSRSMENGSSN